MDFCCSNTMLRGDANIYEMKGRCNMDKISQEEILKSDQLCSVAECEEAIRFIANRTGKNALDIWRANEKRLSLMASSISRCLTNKRYTSVPLVVACLAIVGSLVWEICSHGQITGVFVGVVVCVLPFILASQWPGGYVRVGQICRYFLGIVFSVELFLLSYLPWDSGGVNTFREVGEYVKSIGYFTLWVLLTVVSYYLVVERPYGVAHARVKDELSTLRFARGLLCDCDTSMMDVSENKSRSFKRPRPLPGNDTPNPAYHPHTLNYEEPNKSSCVVVVKVCLFASVIGCVTALASLLR